MLKVLINAYACSPHMGSEPGMAWNWCIHLAKYCELHVITEGEFRDKIEAELHKLPQAKNLHFYYNPVPERVREMCWNQGDWRFYKYYQDWQWKTYQIALGIVQQTPIDIIHQLNMIGFREPGYLWKINDIPFIWGPVDAKEAFPSSFLQHSNLKNRLFTNLKNSITRLQLRYSPRVRQAVQQASVVVSASSNSQQSFIKYFKLPSILINETGCYIQEKTFIDKNPSTYFDVLWVGKFDFRKQLILAIQAIAASKNSRLRLQIIGNGDKNEYQKLAESLNVDQQCVWYGAIPFQDVQRLMQQSEVLLFTSVAEGTPHVVLEAISNELPVVCFDTCGQGDAVNEKVGIKIDLTNPSQSVHDFAQALNYLESNRDILKELSANCVARQRELSWDNKALQMVNLYQECLSKTSSKSEEIA